MICFLGGVINRFAAYDLGFAVLCAVRVCFVWGCIANRFAACDSVFAVCVLIVY